MMLKRFKEELPMLKVETASVVTYIEKQMQLLHQAATCLPHWNAYWVTRRYSLQLERDQLNSKSAPYIAGISAMFARDRREVTENLTSCQARDLDEHPEEELGPPCTQDPVAERDALLDAMSEEDVSVIEEGNCF